jgi:LysM repeat protein
MGRLVLSLVVLGIPLPAQAGVASFFSGLLRGTVERPQPASVLNSQTMPLLQAAMNPDPNPAKGGGDITIVDDEALLSEAGPSGTLANIEEGHGNGQISIYVVREGDSLSGIAKMFKVSVNTIVWANDIKGGLIKPGQTLVILPVSGVRHTVAKGETLASIAKKYKGDLEEITGYNSLKSDAVLAVGDVIVIPDGEISSPSQVVRSSGVTSPLRGVAGPTYEGYYMRPISGGSRSQGLHGFNGVDLAAPRGTPVYASAAGQVVVSLSYGWNGGYGQYIVIQHANNTQTLYAHLSANLVGAGMSVAQGQVIGSVGNTGKSTGPHVHFEIRGAKNPF